MGAKMTWKEMKKAFPDEWLLITDYERDQRGNIKFGIVERHSSEKDDIYQPLAVKKPAAFEYTGESTFRGLRSHAEHHCF